MQLLAGSAEARSVRALGPDQFRESEFGVFSQWGEDGIIQFLLAHVPIADRAFVEFGVEDYREANTRFLLQHDYWAGLILDRGQDHVEYVERSGLAWRHTIEARSSFLDCDNINQVIADGGMRGDIGLLSVDVDGNDYWLLDAIDVVAPRILVAEYNSLFGPTASVTVPYDPGFDRRTAHGSGLYYGASLTALTKAAERKGMSLVGCNRAGVNAFFVRSDLVGDIPTRTPHEAFVERQHREARAADGALLYTSGAEAQRALIAGAPLVTI
ncbi:MAG: hypothetical protein QOJ00_2412 [Actinomycetota bacterium]